MSTLHQCVSNTPLRTSRYTALLNIAEIFDKEHGGRFFLFFWFCIVLGVRRFETNCRRGIAGDTCQWVAEHARSFHLAFLPWVRSLDTACGLAFGFFADEELFLPAPPCSLGGVCNFVFASYFSLSLCCWLSSSVNIRFSSRPMISARSCADDVGDVVRVLERGQVGERRRPPRVTSRATPGTPSLRGPAWAPCPSGRLWWPCRRGAGSARRSLEARNCDGMHSADETNPAAFRCFSLLQDLIASSNSDHTSIVEVLCQIMTSVELLSKSIRFTASVCKNFERHKANVNVATSCFRTFCIFALPRFRVFAFSHLRFRLCSGNAITATLKL